MGNLALVIGVLVVIFLIALLCIRKMRSRVLSKRDQKFLQSAWQKVEAMEDSAMQILEADKVLDQALKRLGYKGSLGEKLKTAGPRFSNLDAVWNAHKLRNRIAHEVNISVTQEEARFAMFAFKKALEQLGL